jgi:hypothetical protein
MEEIHRDDELREQARDERKLGVTGQDHPVDPASDDRRQHCDQPGDAEALHPRGGVRRHD